MDMEGRKVGGQYVLLPRKWEEAATVAGFALGFGVPPCCLRTSERERGSLRVTKGSSSEEEPVPNVLTAGKKGPSRVLPLS